MPKIKEGLISADLYAFLTCEPKDVVGSIHMKAMPAILTTSDEVETCLTAPWSEARVLQRPLANGVLEVVAVGEKEDPLPPQRWHARHCSTRRSRVRRMRSSGKASGCLL